MSKNYVRKIETKTVIGDAMEVYTNNKAKVDKKPLAVYTIIGLVKKYKIVTGQYGDSYQFKGNFEANNLLSKEVFTSTTAYLPEEAADLIVPVIDQFESNNDQLQIGFEITMEKADKGARPYRWGIKPLFASQHDPLENLKKQIAFES